MVIIIVDYYLLYLSWVIMKDIDIVIKMSLGLEVKLLREVRLRGSANCYFN